jgi:adenylate cyclase
VNAVFRIQESVQHINARLDGEFVLGVGIGIATGTALTTNLGSTNCDDYTMVGDSINIASRLQGQAAPGEVLVTEDAYKTISAAFPGAMRSEYLLKGISQPVAAHRLVRGPSATTWAAKWLTLLAKACAEKKRTEPVTKKERETDGRGGAG